MVEFLRGERKCVVCGIVVSCCECTRTVVESAVDDAALIHDYAQADVLMARAEELPAELEDDFVWFDGHVNGGW